MRGAPHSGLSTLIRRISARRSTSICGRPPRDRDFQRQYRRKPARCQTHKGLWSDDRDGTQDRWKPSIQLDEEEAIPIRKLDTTAHLPPQYDQLTSERHVLCLKSALRLEWRDQDGQQEAEQRRSSPQTLGDSLT